LHRAEEELSGRVEDVGGGAVDEHAERHDERRQDLEDLPSAVD